MNFCFLCLLLNKISLAWPIVFSNSIWPETSSSTTTNLAAATVTITVAATSTNLTAAIATLVPKATATALAFTNATTTLYWLVVTSTPHLRHGVLSLSASLLVIWVAVLLSALSYIVCIIVHRLHCIGLLCHLVLLLSALPLVVWVAVLSCASLSIVCVFVHCLRCCPSSALRWGFHITSLSATQLQRLWLRHHRPHHLPCHCCYHQPHYQPYHQPCHQPCHRPRHCHHPRNRPHHRPRCWECNNGNRITIDSRQKVVLSINGDRLPLGRVRCCYSLLYSTCIFVRGNSIHILIVMSYRIRQHLGLSSALSLGYSW